MRACVLRQLTALSAMVIMGIAPIKVLRNHNLSTYPVCREHWFLEVTSENVSCQFESLDM